MAKGKKGKSVANIPRIQPTQQSYPTVDNRGSMNRFFGSMGAPQRGPGSILNQLKAEREQGLLREYRELQHKKEEQKLKLEMDQMKQDLGVDASGGGLKLGGMLNFTPQDIQDLSKMSAEDRQTYIETAKQLGTIASMAGTAGKKGSEATALMQWMAMGGFRGGQPGLGLKDIMQLQQMWSTIYKGAGGGQNEMTNTLLIKLLTDTMPSLQNQAIGNMQMAYQAQIANLQQNQSDPKRELSYFKEYAEMMGYRPGAMSDTVAIEIAKMNNMMALKDWELRKEELQSRKTLGTIQQILQQVNIPELARNMMRRDVGGARQQPLQQPMQPGEVVNPLEPAPAQTDFSKAPMPGIQPPTGKLKVLDYQCPFCNNAVSAIEGTPLVTCTSCGRQFRTLEGAR